MRITVNSQLVVSVVKCLWPPLRPLARLNMRRSILDRLKMVDSVIIDLGLALPCQTSGQDGNFDNPIRPFQNTIRPFRSSIKHSNSTFTLFPSPKRFNAKSTLRDWCSFYIIQQHLLEDAIRVEDSVPGEDNTWIIPTHLILLITPCVSTSVSPIPLYTVIIYKH